MSQPLEFIESLDPRRYLASIVDRIQPELLGTSFDRTERTALLKRLTNLPSDVYSALKKRLDRGKVGAFDDILLSYFRNRRAGTFFFDEAHGQPIADFITDNDKLFDDETIVERATAITRRHFPKQSSVLEYTVRMPANIKWNNPDPENELGVEFLHAIHRHDWFDELAQAYLFTNDKKYARELTHELADWSMENPSGEAPINWSTRDRKAWWFDTAIRTDQWIWTYFMMLGSTAWTPATNSLFLYKLVQSADVMEQILPDVVEFTSNKTVQLGKSLHQFGLIFPEFNTASIAEVQGRSILFQSMDAQLYADGSHVEQSPGYALLILDDMLEARLLDAINGVDWPNRRIKKITRGVNAIWNLVSPDSHRPAIGDTYRLPVSGLFLRGSLILEATLWPRPRPSLHDMWLLGPTKLKKYLTKPTIAPLGDRPAAFSLTDSGQHILRSGNDKYARQMHFDAGPKGGGHGHYDLLGIELFGYGKALIADPGAYVYDESRHREWVVSTAAHNTIGVAGLNHSAIEEDWTKQISATTIRNVAGGYQVAASHLGYNQLPGQPILGRSVWFDGNSTYVIVDYAESSSAYTYESSFNLPESSQLIESRSVASDDERGNVRVDVLLRKGQQMKLETEGIFATNSPPPEEVEKRTRLSIRQKKGRFVVFAYVISTHLGEANRKPNVSWSHVPTSIEDAAILNVEGKKISFPIPTTRVKAARAR